MSADLVSLTNEAAQLVETTFDGASGAGLDEDVPIPSTRSAAASSGATHGFARHTAHGPDEPD